MQTHIRIQGSFFKIVSKSEEEYSKLISFTSSEEWEYFTYNPMVNNRAKYCLKDLPNYSEIQDIQTAFLDEEIHVFHIRQMTKSSTVDNMTSQNFIPVRVLTVDNTRDKLLNMTGILHFRVKIEDLKHKQTVTQCLRCQDFGHKAPFCKLTRKCRVCAELHDTRDCPDRDRTPKCAGCGRGHPASYSDCRKRLKFTETMKKQPVPSPVISSEFPALPSNPQPPLKAWKPKPTFLPPASTYFLIFDL